MKTPDRAYKNWPNYNDDLVNKIYVDLKVAEGDSSGDIEELKQQVAQNTSNIAANTRDIVNVNTNKLDKDTYNTFKAEEYNPLVVKVDGKIQSFYQSTDPSESWTTSVEKETHVGDIWYNTTNQKTMVYYKDTSSSPTVYYWQWQNVPTELLNTIDNKATIYSGVVPSNYKTGDYWIIPLNCYSNTI